MGLLTNLYYSAYEFWTGFELDYPLHSHASRGQLEEIQKLIPKIKTKVFPINAYNKAGIPALGFCFFDSVFCENIEKRYEIAILFLELGATPYLPTLQGQETILHNSITIGNIGTQRLLIWYDPNYEGVLDLENFTAAERLNKKGLEEYKKIIEKTAQDAKAVKKLFANAEALKNKPEFLHSIETAIGEYKKAAEIFKKQGEIEKTLIYPPLYERSRPVLLNFYRKKAFECHQKAEACYTKLEHTPEVKKAHLEILHLLANEATALKQSAEAIEYARKIAELTIETKTKIELDLNAATKLNDIMSKQLKTNSEITLAQNPNNIDNADNEFTPLLSLAKENSKQKTHVTDQKSDAVLRKRTLGPVSSTIGSGSTIYNG